MRVIVGLGNPGSSYKDTRHNVGFMVADEVAKRLKLKFRRNIKVKARKAGNSEILIFKPQVFMNLSGYSLEKIKDRFSLNFSDILVICDDLNLPLGKIRMRLRGGAGGHNGLKSIIDSFQTEQFPRLRIGLGEAVQEKDVSEFVLSKFSGDEKKVIKDEVALAADCALEWTREENAEKVMAKFN